MNFGQGSVIIIPESLKYQYQKNRESSTSKNQRPLVNRKNVTGIKSIKYVSWSEKKLKESNKKYAFMLNPKMYSIDPLFYLWSH